MNDRLTQTSKRLFQFMFDKCVKCNDVKLADISADMQVLNQCPKIVSLAAT